MLEEEAWQLSGDLAKLVESGDATVDWLVGTWDDGEWGTMYGKDSGLYAVSADGLTITSCATQMAAKGAHDLRVVASVMQGDTTLSESDNDFWFHLQERELSYDREQDRDLLPGWDGEINKSFNLWVRDENHPDGEDFECTVERVEVTEGANLIEFDSSTWHYRAKEPGTATLKVTYQKPEDLGGGTGTYDIKLKIVEDEYHLEGLATQRHDGFILPGETVDVWLQGYHQYAVHNDDGSWDIAETTNGLSYVWEMEPSRPDYTDIATMTVDENDPTHVTITANVLDHESRPGAGVTVSVQLEHDGVGVARAGWTINICDSIPDFEPAAIDCDLGVGESTTIDPKLIWRKLDENGEIVSEPFEPEGLQLSWSYDTDAIRITDAEGNVVTNDEGVGNGPYTIERLNDSETMICLMARWPEGDDTHDARDCIAQYRLVAARGVNAHKPEHVAAKAATLSATGLKEHWKCKVCGKLFLDENAAQATTLEEVTIAKLTDISTTTVTFPARTYTGSEQTTLPVVKLGDNTLAKDTDYTVTGTTKTTNAGTYEVTITGMGVYGGSRKESYTVLFPLVNLFFYKLVFALEIVEYTPTTGS